MIKTIYIEQQWMVGTEAAGGKVQKRRPPADPVQGHIRCDIRIYISIMEPQFRHALIV